MEKDEMILGQVVRSVAGRDKGKFMVIVKIHPENLLSLADGDLRRMEKSKVKKAKHVAKTNVVIEEINEKLSKGLKVNNAELRRGLDRYKSDCLGEQEDVK
jgi:ribosomal protein L14E/L6E/L27E